MQPPQNPATTDQPPETIDELGPWILVKKTTRPCTKMTEANGKVTQKRGNNMGRRESTTVPLTQSPFAAIAETEEDFVPTENSLSIYKESDTRVAEGKKIDVTKSITGDGRKQKGKNENNKEIATATVAKGEKENLAPVAKGLIGDIRPQRE